MKESNEDPRLSRLLGEWPAKEPLPPRFREGVWQRIATAERTAVTKPAFSLPAWVSTWLARPAFAPVCVAILVGAGLATGYFWAGHDAARWESQLSSHYTASINPYAATQP